MKLITITVTLLMMVCLAANAQITTNKNDVPTISTNESSGKEYGGYELTFGGGGSTIKGKTEIGFDVSLSTNPFKARPEVWLGVAQCVYWSPVFSGTTDLYADWNTHLFKELYLNTGWSVGAVYGSTETTLYRTGPELSLQYYTDGNAFVYVGANYDFITKGESGIRYSFGIGLTF